SLSLGASVSETSSRSGGKKPSARSGHSSSTTAPSGKSSKPSSASSAGPARRGRGVGGHGKIGGHEVGYKRGGGGGAPSAGVGAIGVERGTGGGLARPEIARERDEVAGFKRIGDVDGEPAGGVLIGQRHREARRGGGGQGHGMPRRPLARAWPASVTPPFARRSDRAGRRR